MKRNLALVHAPPPTKESKQQKGGEHPPPRRPPPTSSARYTTTSDLTRIALRLANEQWRGCGSRSLVEIVHLGVGRDTYCGGT